MDFKSILSDKRMPVATPESIIDSDGKSVFGTFDKEFKNLNLMDVDKQCPYLPNWFNWFRLTQWEAVEVNFKDYILLMGVSDMGLPTRVSFVFMTRRSVKLHPGESRFLKPENRLKSTKVLLTDLPAKVRVMTLKSKSLTTLNAAQLPW